jgi:hypothetical protein
MALSDGYGWSDRLGCVSSRAVRGLYPEMTLHLTPAKNLQRVFDMTRGEVVRAREGSAA